MAQTPVGGYAGHGGGPSPVGEEYQAPPSQYDAQGYQAFPGYPPAPAGYSGYGPPVPPQPRSPKAQILVWQIDEDITPTLFDDPDKRRAFIRKVYSILMIQLLITLGIIALFLFSKDLQIFVFSHPWIFWVAIMVNLLTVIALSCCTTLRRKVPLNYIFLFIFTINASILLGIVTCKYKANAVFLAVAITAAVCLALTLFALQTKWDFTIMGGMIISGIVVLFLFGTFAYLVRSKIMTLLYACVGALIFSFFLVYKTQLIMGGNHRYTISPDEYIFAALSLYIDIISIFTYIFAIISGSSGNES